MSQGYQLSPRRCPKATRCPPKGHPRATKVPPTHRRGEPRGAHQEEVLKAVDDGVYRQDRLPVLSGDRAGRQGGHRGHHRGGRGHPKVTTATPCPHSRSNYLPPPRLTPPGLRGEQTGSRIQLWPPQTWQWPPWRWQWWPT